MIKLSYFRIFCSLFYFPYTTSWCMMDLFAPLYLLTSKILLNIFLTPKLLSGSLYFDHNFTPRNTYNQILNNFKILRISLEKCQPLKICSKWSPVRKMQIFDENVRKCWNLTAFYQLRRKKQPVISIILFHLYRYFDIAFDIAFDTVMTRRKVFAKTFSTPSS